MRAIKSLLEIVIFSWCLRGFITEQNYELFLDLPNLLAKNHAFSIARHRQIKFVCFRAEHSFSPQSVGVDFPSIQYLLFWHNLKACGSCVSELKNEYLKERLTPIF
jgi:hypothetical protein